MPDDAPPNILFLFADQLQAFALGCMGNDDIHTPNLDALAADGVLFRNAYSDSPVCTPYRGCLVTGLYPSQSGIRNNAASIRPDERCIGHGLKDAGYRASYIGKWHLGATGNVPIEPDNRAGFEEFIGYQCYNSFIDEVLFFDEEGSERRFTERHRTAATTDLAIERLARFGDDPFALFVSYQNPHYPIEPDPAFAALYAQTDLEIRPNVDPQTPPFTPTFSPRSPRPVERDPNFQRYGRSLKEFQRLYYGLVSQLDHEIGRLIRRLKSHGLYEKTLILFTSDHGEMMGSHGKMNKGLPDEESCRVPLIARLPGGRRGVVEETPVSAGIDIWPTLAEAAGYAESKTLSGTSWLPALREDTTLERGPVFAEHPWPGKQREGTWLMVRHGNWKMVVDRDSLEVESVFDLADDPYEMRDRKGDVPEAVAEELRTALEGWHRMVRKRHA